MAHKRPNCYLRLPRRRMLMWKWNGHPMASIFTSAMRIFISHLNKDRSIRFMKSTACLTRMESHAVDFIKRIDLSYEIYRMSYPNGKPEKVAEKAFWPRISSDA